MFIDSVHGEKSIGQKSFSQPYEKTTTCDEHTLVERSKEIEKIQTLMKVIAV